MVQKVLKLLARKKLFNQKRILWDSSFVASKIHLGLLIKNMTKNEFLWT